MKRREFIAILLGTAAIGLLWKGQPVMAFIDKDDPGNDPTTPLRGLYRYELTDEEWKKKLTKEQYRVLRKSGTERAGTSPLNKEKRKGTYHCAGCNWPLYSSEHKYESGTGWPSFWQPINDTAIGTSTDYFLLRPRTEVHCANCGSHLGHVFEDGPEPTGLRYCMNGVAMIFKPE